MAQNAGEKTLPSPDKKGGIPLMKALNERQTTRSFSNENLSDQQLSDLLWAAFGINRTDSKKRTAPSANNKQEIDIYVFLQEGTFLYLPETHSLKRINREDLRSLTGSQAFVKNAAVNLVYVANFERVPSENPDESLKWSFANAGHISQNVYLYGASAGLGVVVRGWVDGDLVKSKLQLNEKQYVLFAQTIGKLTKQ